MVFDLIYQAIAFICVTLFLPLPVFWLALHRNIAYFRKHKKHALYMKLVMLVLAAVFAFSDITELAMRIETDIIMKIVGAVLFFSSIYIAYKARKILGRAALIGVAELENRKRLVASSMYKSVRHPRYLGIFLFLLGVFLVTGLISILYLLVYSIVMLHIVTAEEEKELEKRLGKKYKAYKRRTGRFVPKFSL